jgi:gluconate kinase
MVINDPDYKHWLTDLKNKIRSVQIKAAIIVNSALIHFYWDLGRMISEKQTVWGVKFVETLSRDLQKEFPDLKGFSRRNLYNARQFYEFYTI